ncbi:hypothetical protein H6G89_04745 [Oscillatoria sp. FACHB-1407]|uniref:LamG-like jellyroll fold domain-containing protein n=1 Tax=Oscillatoria sp. FACHB-1407 TaxID=2692847 RepID=UPI0016871A1F|nr:LamG-like jellyroll fold domain-containing protein [Oscillatoria sp. FACHB-1407]MBD2460346.1 hypothetical protein [Oscillatoria sp. FACHB-1407]
MAIANQVIYNNFVQSFGAQGTTYKHTATVRHKGVVIAFAMDQDRQICYAVLNLEDPDSERALNEYLDPQSTLDKDPKPKKRLDKDFWAIDKSGKPKILEFSNEIAEVGFGIADQTAMPVILKDSKTEPQSGQRVLKEKRDPFLSTTARLTADAPFQVLSDNQYVYVFRQSIDSSHPDRVWKRDRSGSIVKDASGQNVPLVNSTLLVDRFILSGTTLMSKLEVRFQRSRSKSRPQSRKDSLGTKDLEDNWFYEPTQELRFIRNLTEGQFAVTLLPTQVAGLQRWQIFAHNSLTQQIDAYNVERSKDGLFNTQGSPIYTCEDHPEVYSLIYGKCTLPSLSDDSRNCNKPLVAIAQKSGCAESCLGFEANNSRIMLEPKLKPSAKFTLETWIQPLASNTSQGFITTKATPDKDTPFSVWVERGTRLKIGLGDGTGWFEFVTPGLLQPGEWNHVAIAFDGSRVGSSCRIYINGRLRYKSADLNDKRSVNTAIGFIGAENNAFQGKVDEIRFWDRALTPEFIRENRHQRLTGQEPGLIAYWRFDEARGTRIYDQTDNGCNGTVANAKWITSDAPIGEAPGISRNRFRVEGRSITSGLSALLYYQQLDAAKSGTLNPAGSEAGADPHMPFKQSARLMLAFATQSTEATATGKPEIATLDFGVAATGRLALAPDVLSLQRTESKTANSQEDINTQLEVIQTLEELIQSTQQEIVNLEKERQNYTQAIEYADALPKFLVRDSGLIHDPTPLIPSISDPALTAKLEALQLKWVNMQQAGNEYVDRYRPLERADVRFYEHAEYTGSGYREFGIRPTTPYKDLGDDFENSLVYPEQFLSYKDIPYEILKAHGFDDKITSLKTSNSLKVIGKTRDGQDITANVFEIKLYQDPGHNGREFPGIFTDIPDLTSHKYQVSIWEPLHSWNDKVSSILLQETEEYAAYRIKAELEYLKKKKQFLAAQTRELASLRANLDAINSPQTQLDKLKADLATKKDGLKEGGLVVPMPLIHVDPMGLTVAGAILGFTWTKSAPVLFDSAMGKLALYFQGLDDQFFVAYYRTLTQRASYAFPSLDQPSITFYSRSLEPEFDDLKIAISGDDPTTCTITITLDLPQSPNSSSQSEDAKTEQALVETWQRVPRNPQTLARVLNGQAIKRELLGAGRLVIQDGILQSLILKELSDWTMSSASASWLSPSSSSSQSNPSGVQQRLLRAGSFLRIGNTPLLVKQDVTLTIPQTGKAAIVSFAVESTSLTLSDEELPIFILEYDYAAYAATTITPSDLENGSMLVAVVAEAGNTQAIANATRSNAATLACQWVAAAPGSTLTFDGKSTHALAKSDQLKNFRVERDLTVEAWVRPNRIGETAAILSSRLDSTSYQFGLQKRSGMSAFRAADASSFLPIVLDGAFTLECWFYIQPGRQSITTLNILFHGIQTPMERLTNSFVAALQWNEETAVAELILETTPGTTTATLEPKDKRPGLSINRWHHLAVTFDGRTYRSYVSGQLYSQLAVGTDSSNIPKTQFTGLGPRLNTPAYDRLAAGVIPHFSNYPQLFSGVIDHVRIWRGARSLDTIRANMFLRLNGNEAGLELYLTCEDRVLIDLSRYQRLHKPLLPTNIFSSVLPSYAVYFGIDRQWVQTKTTLPARNWGHIAAVFNQSFAVQFDGWSGYLNCKDSSAMLNITTDLTLEVFLQIDQLGNQYGLLCKGKLTDSTDQAVPYALTIRTDGRLEFSYEAFVRENTETVKIEHVKFLSSTALVASKFYHIAITRKRVNGNNQSSQTSSAQSLNQWDVIQVYVNNQKDAEHRYPSTGNRPGGYLAGEGIGSSNQPLTMGCLTTGDRQNSFFQGAIAEVRIWNVARTLEQIEKTPDGREKGLVGWWRFEDYEGFVVTDSKGNNHAQLTDGVTWIKNPNPQGSTIALYLNGLAVEVEPAPNIAALAPSENQFTIGASNPTALTQYFQGELEEVRVWQVARTPEQILDNLFQRVLGDRGQLIAHYTFDAETVDANGRGTLRDHSFRENDLTVPKASYVYSTAPIGDDIPLARNALAGFRTMFHGLIQSAPAVTEYGDLQYDTDGNMFGVLKRFYSFVYQRQWYLITGFKVGNLVTQWLGQVQFDPQIKGFIEGAPPVPSENLTDTGYNVGEVDDYTDASTVELVEASEKTYTYSLNRDRGFDNTVDVALDILFGAPQEFNGEIYNLLGAQVVNLRESMDLSGSLGIRYSHEISQSWLDEASVESSISTQQTSQMQLRGYFENPGEQGDGIQYAIGRRFVPENMGMALVESETADIFALRLEHNQALVSYQIRPNPDIPKDWNIITFPINPFYTKQGTLDGKVGNEPDQDYPNAFAYSSDSSYFKPIEAYALKKRIKREEEELQAYYDQYNAGEIGTKDDAVTRMGANKKLKDQLPRVGKRNLVNTYVWTADGGLFAETQETLDVRQEATGGSYNFLGMAGVAGSLQAEIAIWKFRFGISFEAQAMFGGHFNLTAMKGLESQNGFSLNVSLDKVEGTIYERTEDRNVVMENGKPKKKAGKVDAYRFMSFYLEPRSEHHDLFFNQVVDQRWLRQSNDPNAKALLQAEQDVEKPACWRIMHRVTYVSRVLPEFDHAAPLEKTMKSLELESNYELVKTLDPFIRNKTNNFVEFAAEVRRQIAQYLPELQPHTQEILQWLTLYYGVVDDTGLSDTAGIVVELPERGNNAAPFVDAGSDLTAKVGENATLMGVIRDDRHSSEDLFVTWSLTARSTPKSNLSLTGGVTPESDLILTNPHALVSTVQFAQKGLYRFTLTASDGYLTGEDEVVVTVNQSPIIAAGVDQTLRFGEKATLSGKVLDDGLGDPSSSELNIEWSQEDGPGVVTFDNLQALTTGVTFSERGRYELRLTVNNGSFEASETVVMIVGMRSPRNLLALYLFNEGSGTLVQDVSGTEPALNLTIQAPTASRWSPGRLSLTASNLITATTPTQPLVKAFQDTNEITVEAWIQPPSSPPSGLTRIVTLSNGASDRNFTVGQTGNTYQFCLRTTDTNDNASTQVLASSASSSNSEVHLVCTRDASGQTWLYLNGRPVSQRLISGTFANWQETFLLALGNEVNNPNDSHPREWLGTFNLVALYNRALSPQEVADHYDLGGSPLVLPVVDVGSDRVVNLEKNQSEATIILSARVRHEQFSAGTINTEWKQLSGPSKVTLSTPTQLATAVSFKTCGIYEFKLTAKRRQSANEQSQLASDKLRVVVNEAPKFVIGVLINGEDVPYTAIPPLKLSDVVQVTGQVHHSGLGDSTQESISARWQADSSNSDLTIVTPQAATTTLQFAAAGSYTVRWVVSNGSVETSQPLTFKVDALPTLHILAPQVIPLLKPTLVQVTLNTGNVFSASANEFWYHARQLQGPANGVNLSHFPANSNLTFEKSGVYEIEVTATNGYLTASQRFTVQANAAPVVRAGSDRIITLSQTTELDVIGGDRIVNLPQTIMLDAIVSDDGLPSDPGRVTLQWSVSDPENTEQVIFTPSDSDYTAATFSAKGRYRIRFTANDGNATGSDELSVVVNTAPIIELTAPKIVTLPTDAILDGQVIDDGLGDPALGALTYRWEQMTGPAIAQITPDLGIPRATVHFTQGGRYSFRLTVDNGFASTTATVPVLANVAPVVTVGLDRMVNLFDTTYLEGDVRDDLLPQETTVEWTQVNPAHLPVRFGDARSLTTSVTFPDIGIYVLRLTGDDGAATASDELTILVNKPPVIEASAPPLINLPDSVTLTGRVLEEGRGDLQQGSITVNWRQIGGPTVSTIESADSLTSTVTLTSSGEHIFELTVSNGFLSTAVQVVVVANEAPVVEVGGDRIITLPQTAVLHAVVQDDGLPNPPGEVTLQWSHIGGEDGQVQFAQSNANYTEAIFSAKGWYRIALTATDGHATSRDELDIVVHTAPLIQLKAQQPLVTLPAEAVLTGEVIDDGRGDAAMGDLTYHWEPSQGSESALLRDTTTDPTMPTASVTFTQGGRYTFHLTVSNGFASTTATVTVLANEAPVVAAGSDRVGNLLDILYLQGNVRDDLLPQETTVEWTQVSPTHLPVRFGDARSPETFVIFPDIGVYVLRLTGNDGAATASDELTILINKPPVIEVSAPPLINLPNSVTLTGRVLEEGRGDPQQGSITVNWRQTSGAGIVTLEDANSLTSTATFPGSGEYTFEFTVSNGFLSTSAQVVVVANAVPMVNAGTDLLVNLPDTAKLNGTVQDDGLPTPPGAITVIWSKVSGPGTVTFGTQTLETTASFSESGIYTLRLIATDGAIASYDDVTVIANQPPVVNAGLDQKVNRRTVTLSGTVTDDQLPSPGVVTTEWSVVSGPGTVTFSQPNALITQATFSKVGTYVLRLTANDGAAIAHDDVTLNVNFRVTNDLIALYTFEEGDGLEIQDRSEVGEPMNLFIAEGDRTKVEWLSTGGLSVLPTNPVTAAASISTKGAATKLIQAVKASNQITVEVWYRPASDRPIYLKDTPIRLLSISAPASAAHRNRNFILQQGQWKIAQANFYHTRIRTPSRETNDEEGLQTQAGTIQPHITTEGTTGFKLNHVVYTWDGNGTGRLYVDGVLKKEEKFATPRNGWGNTFTNWDDTYAMALARDPSGNWPGRGTFHLVAIYKRALTTEEVMQNHKAYLIM